MPYSQTIPAGSKTIPLLAYSFLLFTLRKASHGEE
jgi:hypothetical protein